MLPHGSHRAERCVWSARRDVILTGCPHLVHCEASANCFCGGFWGHPLWFGCGLGHLLVWIASTDCFPQLDPQCLDIIIHCHFICVMCIWEWGCSYWCICVYMWGWEVWGSVYLLFFFLLTDYFYFGTAHCVAFLMHEKCCTKKKKVGFILPFGMRQASHTKWQGGEGLLGIKGQRGMCQGTRSVYVCFCVHYVHIFTCKLRVLSIHLLHIGLPFNCLDGNCRAKF